MNMQHSIEQLRTPAGLLLMATALIGVFMGAHWQPMIFVMLPFYALTLLAPALARRPETWILATLLWAVAVVVRRNNMEDHVYLYLAWLVAVAVSLIDYPSFLEQVRRHGRYLIAVVFGFATVWMITSLSFLNGTALWTIGLLDDRLGPLMRIMGISPESFDVARPQVERLVQGDSTEFELGLSGYSTATLLGLSLITILTEAMVAVAHAVPDNNRLAALRAPALVIFGIVTYAVVPVLPFALLLAMIGSTIAFFERRAVTAFAVMVLISVIRFLTL